MPFHQSDEIRYFTFASFEDAGIQHAVLSRKGGVSPQPWDSLNVGGTVGDDAGRVQTNRQRSFAALNRPYDSLFDVWQVHSTKVVCANTPRPPDSPHQQADAILTDRPEVTLFMRFADCVPIFLFDPVHRAVGLVHAGWRGTVDNIIAPAVQAMRDRYHSVPADILAGIGPAIGPHHYQVGNEVVECVQRTFGVDAPDLLPGLGGESGVQFDLWSANRLLLENAGVHRIEISAICTACETEDWYSHRAEHGKTGRFGALIGL